MPLEFLNYSTGRADEGSEFEEAAKCIITSETNCSVIDHN